MTRQGGGKAVSDVADSGIESLLSRLLQRHNAGLFFLFPRRSSYFSVSCLCCSHAFVICMGAGGFWTAMKHEHKDITPPVDC